MQLNQVFKGFLLITSIFGIGACSSSYKDISNTKDNTASINSINEDDIGLNNRFNHINQIRIPIQELHRNNIFYFDLDKYNIRFDSYHMLEEHANFLRTHPYCKVIIEGHTDETGTREYNIALGKLRANAIKIHLLSKGVSEQQITIVSYGKEKPAIIGHDNFSYAKNRRAVLVY